MFKSRAILASISLLADASNSAGILAGHLRRVREHSARCGRSKSRINGFQWQNSLKNMWSWALNTGILIEVPPLMDAAIQLQTGTEKSWIIRD